MDDDLNRFDEWFGQILNGLAPAQRRKAAMTLGRELRKSNVKRIGANIQPDGTPMEKRKPRNDRRGRLRARNKGKMFKGLRRLRNWKIEAGDDGVTLRPATNSADRVASVSHFGETATVGRLASGGEVRARYPIRRMLGLSPEDERLTLEIATSLLQPDD